MKTGRHRMRKAFGHVGWVLVVSTIGIARPNAIVGVQQKQNALISPSSGNVGVFVLGSRVSQYSNLRQADCRVPGAPSGEVCYATNERDFLVGVDRRGYIAAVRTTSSEMFTDRYIRPRYTRMKDVVSRHGVPERIDRNESMVFFVYGNLLIEAEAGRTSEEIMPKSVVALTLRRTAARRSSRPEML